MVTRAVEKAQMKVETMHYEGRKQVVEYDDVANEQRKIVYKFRNQLLSEDFDIASKVNEIREEYVANLFSQCDIYDGGDRDDFNVEKLSELLQEQINFGIKNIEQVDYDELLESITLILKGSYDEKMSVLEESVRVDIEKEFYLKELDSAWREHLYSMDMMKTGIRLRAYNQKDPLVEYKKESFALFSDLINEIKFNTIRTLQIIQFKVESAEDEAARIAEKLAIEKKVKEAQRIFNHSMENGNAQEPLADKKIARNDPCPCGSGKKYKQCCGKSGPKKGVFAS